jgi:hypothetical protein
MPNQIALAIVVAALIIGGVVAWAVWYTHKPVSTYSGPVPTTISDCAAIGGTWQPPIMNQVHGQCIVP